MPATEMAGYVRPERRRNWKRTGAFLGALVLGFTVPSCAAVGKSGGAAECNFTKDAVLEPGEAVFVQRGYTYIHEEAPDGSQYTRVFGRPILGLVIGESAKWYMMTAEVISGEGEGEKATVQLRAIGPSPGYSKKVTAEVRSEPGLFVDQCVVPDAANRPPDAVAVKYKGGAIQGTDGVWYATSEGGYHKKVPGGAEGAYNANAFGVDMSKWAGAEVPKSMTNIDYYRVKDGGGVLVLGEKERDKRRK